MRSSELAIGRTFGVIFDRGEDFFDSLAAFCKEKDLRQGYIPMFLAAFESAAVVGTCGRVEDPAAPVWSEVCLSNTEAIGCGSIAWDPVAEQPVPHVHTSLGLKEHSAAGHTSHLLSATVQFVTELLIVEVTGPHMRRPKQPDMYDVPLLMFEEG